MTDFNLDWHSIRPLNGSKADGFEELCSQLARYEKNEDAKFVRKGSPDAGVECFAVLPDGTEWAWQAKYFNELGNSQWTQIDDSVRTALDNHPKLSRYYVCTPVDRADARVKKQKSAMDRWNEHRQTWMNWAAENDMNVEFIYWGSHELLERLVKPEHVGRVRFWFNKKLFDQTWFANRLEEALRTAGPRYTPEVHVELPIAKQFDAIGWTETFLSQVQKSPQKLARTVRLFHSYSSKLDTFDDEFNPSRLINEIKKTLDAIKEITPESFLDSQLTKVALQIGSAVSELKELHRLTAARMQTTRLEKRMDNLVSQNTLTKFSKFQDMLVEIWDELDVLGHEFGELEKFAAANLLILRGQAGVGKTHLLCDISQQRIKEGKPTVILMGQRYLGVDAPWSQTLQQLDLVGLSAEGFIGALESAAQAANAKAIIFIDGINEGNGRKLWPSHLASFLAQLEKSKWISTVIAVRSSYEEIIISDEIRAAAECLEHNGFSDFEYDASKAYFHFYGLEFPSAPLLNPEFSNPLFLKTICRGLNARGETRFPRGFHGISSTFSLFLSAMNQTLAASLDFDPKSLLVEQSVMALARAMIDADKRWLLRQDARKIVDSLLPNREFENSLFRGLLAEGIIIEEAERIDENSGNEFVYLAYERLADHLVAKEILRKALQSSTLQVSLQPGGGLFFLTDPDRFIEPGILEALCTQIPELVGQELISATPHLSKLPGMNEAFRQSLVWRKTSAFSPETVLQINQTCKSIYDIERTLNVLLTLATIPNHPLNADFLHKRLEKDEMNIRDSWWSTYLHNTYGLKGPLDRLLDWASSLDSNFDLEEEVIRLASTTLAWSLTTSNRYVRDRATIALVTLLMRRVDLLIRLLRRFADVNDLYVSERLYAVALGVASRLHQSTEIESLAQLVYDQVFAHCHPAPHVLLRDYARSVVERALFLNASIDVDSALIRPPYQSIWPNIPTDEEIQQFMPDWSNSPLQPGEWARNRIGSSVTDDDFARYVIGTNSGITDWLSVRLSEPKWLSRDDKIRQLESHLSADETALWNNLKDIHSQLANLRFHTRLRAEEDSSYQMTPPKMPNSSDQISQKIERLEKRRLRIVQKLKSSVSSHAMVLLDSVLDSPNTHRPQLDLRIIQRYVLQRVFQLGWSPELFGFFDEHVIGYRGRSANKSERIGKKYQWIAYHEILAYLADHFQYRQAFEDTGECEWNGPWENFIRDIDPTCTLDAVIGGTPWSGHSNGWWCSARYNAWDESLPDLKWVKSVDNLPKISSLLEANDERDKSRWFNADGYFSWRQSPQNNLNDDREIFRELWYLTNAYLVRKQDVAEFERWAQKQDFWGRWMPEASEFTRIFMGEFGWAPAALHAQTNSLDFGGWLCPSKDCPTKVWPVSLKYLREAGTFDCAIQDTFSLVLPCNALLSSLALRWTGRGADYIDDNSRLIAQDPTVTQLGPSALLIHRETVSQFLENNDLTLCWTILGEKRIVTTGFHSEPARPSMHFSGLYSLRESGVGGFLKCFFHDKLHSNGTRLIKTLRE